MSEVDETKTRDDETLDDSQISALDDDARALLTAKAKEAAKGVHEALSDTSEASEPKPKKDNKLLGNLIFVVGFILTLVLGYYAGQWMRVKFGDKPEPDTSDRYRVELRGDEPQMGPDDALVTIIEYADYQCPYCAQSLEPLEEAMDAYEGDVRLIFKHYPLPGHTRAAPAAHVAWAAQQQGKFWIFHSRLFEAKASIEKVPEWVKEFDLDAERFGADMESAEAKAAIDGDMLGAGRIGVTGTPAFLVNGHMYRGKRDTIGWKKIIEAERDYAEEIADSEDLAPGEVYAFLMTNALDHQVGAPDVRPNRARKARPGEPDDTSVYAVPVDGASSRGPDDALVTVIEFADYHCPFCSRVQTAVDQLVEAHPDELRLVYRQRPLAMHPHAREASRAALAAGRQDKFWEMHAKLFLRGSKTLDEFKALAEELGLDVEVFVADYESEAVERQLNADIDVAKRFGVSGTPAFFINGRYISGAQSYSVFEQVFQERLVEAQGIVAGGTPASGVYEAIIADGKRSAKE